MSFKNEIERALHCLVGKPFRSIGRAEDLVWLGFGDLVKKVSFDGQEKLVARYALHLQTGWRIIRNESEIVIGFGDLFLDPPQSMPCSDKIENRFDARIEKLLSESPFPVVSEIIADNLGGLIINFAPELRLEILPMDSEGSEQWRFFEMDSTGEHFVVPHEREPLHRVK